MDRWGGIFPQGRISLQSLYISHHLLSNPREKKWRAIALSASLTQTEDKCFQSQCVKIPGTVKEATAERNRADCLAFTGAALLHHLFDNEKNSSNSYYHYLIRFGLISMECPSVTLISTDFPSTYNILQVLNQTESSTGPCFLPTNPLAFLTGHCAPLQGMTSLAYTNHGFRISL